MELDGGLLRVTNYEDRNMWKITIANGEVKCYGCIKK